MSFPLHYRDSAQEGDAIKDYPDAARVPRERNPALKFLLALPRAKDSQQRDAWESENQMTGRSIIIIVVFTGFLKVTFFLGSNMR